MAWWIRASRCRACLRFASLGAIGNVGRYRTPSNLNVNWIRFCPAGATPPVNDFLPTAVLPLEVNQHLKSSFQCGHDRHQPGYRRMLFPIGYTYWTARLSIPVVLEDKLVHWYESKLFIVPFRATVGTCSQIIPQQPSRNINMALEATPLRPGYISDQIFPQDIRSSI
jgi:hypothetical protein